MNYDGLLNQPAGARIDHRHIPPIGRLLPWKIGIQDNALPDKALVQAETIKLTGFRALYLEEFNNDKGVLRPGWGRAPEGWDRYATVFEWIHEVLPWMPIGAPDIIYQVNTNAQHYVKDDLFPGVLEDMWAQVFAAVWERVNGVMRRTRLWKQLHWFGAELYIRPDVASGLPGTSVSDACDAVWAFAQHAADCSGLPLLGFARPQGGDAPAESITAAKRSGADLVWWDDAVVTRERLAQIGAKMN